LEYPSTYTEFGWSFNCCLESSSGSGLVQRWLLGTHQGAVSLDHLDCYLDEFTFRFSRRTSRSRGQLFYRLLQQAVAVGPAPYKAVLGDTWAKSRPQPTVATGVN
jgi:hypothetical protein